MMNDFHCASAQNTDNFQPLQMVPRRQENAPQGQAMSYPSCSIPRMESREQAIGILHDTNSNCWRAVWGQNTMKIDLGCYPTARAAIAAYEECEEDMLGE